MLHILVLAPIRNGRECEKSDENTGTCCYWTWCADFHSDHCFMEYSLVLLYLDQIGGGKRGKACVLSEEHFFLLPRTVKDDEANVKVEYYFKHAKLKYNIDGYKYSSVCYPNSHTPMFPLPLVPLLSISHLSSLLSSLSSSLWDFSNHQEGVYFPPSLICRHLHTFMQSSLPFTTLHYPLLFPSPLSSPPPLLSPLLPLSYCSVRQPTTTRKLQSTKSQYLM